MKPDFVLSIDTGLIYERLVKATPGEEISYAELGEIIDRDIQNEARSALTSARNRAQNLHGIVFGVLRGQGIKRLTDAEIVGTASGAIDSIRRKSRRATKRLSCVENFDGLPEDLRVMHNTRASLLGMIAISCRAPAVKKLEEKVRTAQAKLPLAATLGALRE